MVVCVTDGGALCTLCTPARIIATLMAHKTNLAFLGCAHIHAPNFLKTVAGRDDVQVKTVWDHDAARGQRRADEVGARFIGDLRPILADPEIDAVVICSETDRHQELVLAAAEHRKAMFVEKPLGLGARDANAMADAIERAGVTFQTGYFRRGDPIHLFLKQHVDAGTFGRITRIRGSNCHAGALNGWFDTEWRWMADPKIAGCGAFGDLGTHALDIMIWLLGEVAECTATLSAGTARYGDCDETGEGVMRFKSGPIGTLAAAWDDLANPVSLLISGTDAHAAVINGELFLTSKKLPGADGKTAWRDLPPKQPAGLDAFLDAVTGKPATLVRAREAAYRSAVTEALYDGAARRAWVSPRR
jgi:predicted dehydrogenase